MNEYNLKFIDPKDFQVSQMYKFAKVKDEYRFIVYSDYENHAMMVNKGERAVVAGTIGIWDTGWVLTDNFSISLQVGIKRDTTQELCNAIQRPQLDRNDRSIILAPQ